MHLTGRLFGLSFRTPSLATLAAAVRPLLPPCTEERSPAAHRWCCIGSYRDNACDNPHGVSGCVRPVLSCPLPWLEMPPSVTQNCATACGQPSRGPAVAWDETIHPLQITCEPLECLTLEPQIPSTCLRRPTSSIPLKWCCPYTSQTAERFWRSNTLCQPGRAEAGRRTSCTTPCHNGASSATTVRSP